LLVIITGCSNNNNTESTKTKDTNIEKETYDSLNNVIDSLNSIIYEYQEESYLEVPTEDNFSFLLKSKCRNYIWGITKIEGYYTQNEYPNFGIDYVTCDCFTITNGQKVYLDKINELISNGNDLYYSDSLNRFGSPINLASLSIQESTLIKNSTITEPITLTIFINHPTYTGVPTCYSTFKILRVE